MPIQVFGVPAAVIMLNRAFNDTSPGNLIYANQVAAATANLNGFANDFAASFASLSNADLASRVLGNLGLLPNDALRTALTDYYAANGAANRGLVTLQLANILTSLEGNATYGAAAAAWNDEVATGFTYSANPANTGSQTGTPSQTFTLTTGTDNLTGGSGDDTFSGILANVTAANSTGTTFQAGDVLKGGSGTDTLNVSVTGGATGTNAAVSLTGIEKIFVSNFNGAGQSINLALADSDLATVGHSASGATSVTTFTGLKKIVAAELKNGVSGVTVEYDTSVTVGTADAMSVALANQTGGTFTADGIETLNVSSTVSNNTSVLTGTALKTIVATGDKGLALRTSSTGTEALASTVTRVDASALTGNLTAFLNTNANITVLGGAGNDTIQTGTALGTDGSVDGGAGTDTLVLSAANVVTTAAEGARFKNFETLGVSFEAATSANFTQDTSLVSGITGLAVTRLADTTDSTANFASTVTFNNVGAGVSSLAVSGLTSKESAQTALTVAVNLKANTAADVIAVTLGTATAGAGATAVAAAAGKITNALNLPNYETVSIASNGGANFVSTLTAGEMTSLTISGSKALSIDGITSTLLAKIDASGNTGGFQMVNTADGTANASTVASTVTGGSGNDRLVGGSKADNIDGGAGNDTLLGAGGNDIIAGGAGDDSIIGGAGADKIDAGAGDDTISVTTVTDFTAAVETVDGGAGNDTLSIAENTNITLTAASLAAVTGVENISLNASNNTATVTLTDAVFTAGGVTSLAIKDADLAQGALIVNASALTAANSVSVTANTATGVNDSLVGGAGNDTFTFGATTTALQGTDIVTGGAGTDTIVLTATAANTAVLTNVTGVEVIKTSGTGSTNDDKVTITLTDANIGSATVTTGSITVDASSMTAAAPDLDVNASGITTATKSVSVIGSAGDDTIIGGSGNDTIATGDGADSVTGGAGVDNISLGAGDDVAIMTAAGFAGLVAAETVSGGSGSDTINFSTNENVTLNSSDLAAISGIEILKFAAQGNNVSITLTDSTFTANGATSLTIDVDAATTGDVVISAGSLSAANSMTVIRTAGTADTAGDNIVLGAGNDLVRVDNDQLAGVATINGGAGNDTLRIEAAAGGAAVTLAAGITGFENIAFATAAHEYKIATADANVASGASLTVNGSNLTAGMLFNGSAETNGTFVITGGTGGDTITGGSKADTIAGGLGADVFTYTAVTQSTGTTADSITDFVNGTDKLAFTLNYSAIAVGVDVNAVRLTAVADVTAAQTGLSGRRGEYVYDTGASRLYVNFNADNLITTQDYQVAVNPNSTATATVADGDVNFNITGTAAADTIVAGGGADTIDGAAGTDSITGGAGNDSITAGGGVDTITGGQGSDTINLGANGDADRVVFGGGSGTAGTVARVGTLGVDTITGFSGQADLLEFRNADFNVAAGAVSTDQIVVVANDTTAVATNSSQNLGGGNWSYSAAGFFIVGNNSAGANQTLYFYDGSKTNAGATRTVAELVSDGDAVQIAVIGLIDAALNGSEFAWVS